MENIKNFLANLSSQPGVYQMLDEKGTILYVGKAKNLKKRLASYFNKQLKDLKTEYLVRHTKDIEITITHNEIEAVLLECNLIKKHKPRYNILLRDDKSYPYILITTQHAFPRIELYRGLRKKQGLYFGPYPSAGAVRETINLLQKLFHIRTCRESYYNARSRPCLLYQIDRCSGPCVGRITQEEYAENIRLAILFLQGKSNEVINKLQNKMKAAAQALNFELAANYRNQIAKLKQIQEKQWVSVDEGNADIIGFAMEAGVICVQVLSIRGGQLLGSRSYFPIVPSFSNTDEIINAFLTQHYLGQGSHLENIPKQIILDQTIKEKHLVETVLSAQAKHRVELIKPLRGEKKKWLQMAINNAKESLTTHLHAKTNIYERISALQKELELKDLPERIECFDISHNKGEATVASCVVFDKAGPVKSNYRRFNITDIVPGDDIAAMHQVLARRFKRLKKEEAILPDIVLIDGGKLQLKAAAEALAALDIDKVLLIGISKGPERKPGFETLHFLASDPRHLSSDSLALHFIQQIRDEAHRFAIAGHRNRRDKSRRQSTLELIPGIGAARRRELLRYFGGIQGVAHASLDELANVPGISYSLAERIFAALHDTTL